MQSCVHSCRHARTHTHSCMRVHAHVYTHLCGFTPCPTSLHGWMDRWMDGWMDGAIYICTHACMCICTHVSNLFMGGKIFAYAHRMHVCFYVMLCYVMLCMYVCVLPDGSRQKDRHSQTDTDRADCKRCVAPARPPMTGRSESSTGC